MELGLLHRFLELIHGRATGPGCVWLAIFGAELVFWIWSCVELCQTRPTESFLYGVGVTNQN
jgi:hypothetical protein